MSLMPVEDEDDSYVELHDGRRGFIHNIPPDLMIYTVGDNPPAPLKEISFVPENDIHTVQVISSLQIKEVLNFQTH